MQVSDGWDQALTEEVHAIMKALPDDAKLRFAINWKIPHTLFNVACGMPQHFDMGRFNDSTPPINERKLVDWDAIYKTRDLGNWSHGGPAIV